MKPQRLPVYNASGLLIPSFALMRVTGVDSSNRFTVDLPNADSQLGLLVNGPVVIPPLSAGSGSADVYGPVAYDPRDGKPVAGQVLGAKAGEWRVRKDRTGFTAVGPGSAGVVNTLRVGSPGGGFTPEILIYGGTMPGSAPNSTTVWQDTVYIDLPAAGVYLLRAALRANVTISAFGSPSRGAGISMRLINTTTSGLFGDNSWVVFANRTVVMCEGSACYSIPYSTPAAARITLQLLRDDPAGGSIYLGYGIDWYEFDAIRYG